MNPMLAETLAIVTPADVQMALSGLLNFVRTISGAFGTSIANTVWEDTATSNQAELVGIMGNSQSTIEQLVQNGMRHE